GPTLFFSETPCVFDGGFRGTGSMWYLASPEDSWRRVEIQIEQPKNSKRSVSNGRPVEIWWALVAVPDQDSGFVYECATGEEGAEGAGAVAGPVHERHVSTKDDLAPTPDLPRRWYPFDPWPGSETYQPYAVADDLDLTTPLPAGCPTHVHAFDLYLAGQVRGSLSFNQYKRGGPPYAKPMNDGNTMLGGFESIPNRIMSWKAYKYQVEIRFLGPFQHAFFGQMIASPQSFSFSDPTFDDDSPANDWPGKVWNLAPGDKKSDFPVIEIVTLTQTDHIVRYIDAPGGSEVMGVGLSDKYQYVLIYAGACGVITHVKYLQLYFPDQFRWTDGTPRATEMNLAQFRNAVGSWSFAP
ncbi:MAG: hypothetical protein AB7P12_16690, partial [Alphaproteobacteria bacterium]